MAFDLSTLKVGPDGSYTGSWGPFVLRSGFQPIFNMVERPLRIAAFEALIRPLRNGAPTSPWNFFKLVEKQEGLFVENLTRSLHVLNAGKVIKGDERLFLNFDPSMFATRTIAIEALDLLVETINMAGISRSSIVCEVTEHRTDEIALMDLVGTMRDHGFKVAVDDYGAEDSDMHRVVKLQPDIIKFDAQWIGDLMDAGAPGEDLLLEMVDHFKAKGIETLFEGIEEGWQLDLAVRCKVELIQGYVLAKPVVMPCDFSVFRTARARSDREDAKNTAPSEMPHNTDIVLDEYDPRNMPRRAAPSEIDTFSEVLGTHAQPEVPMRKSFGARPKAVFGKKQA